MNKNVVIGLIVAVIVLGGGFAYYQSTQSKSPTPPQTNTTENSTTGTQETSPAAEENETQSADSEEGTVKEFVIENEGMSFKTKQLTVNKGDTVRITFKNTGGFHDWVLDEFNAKTKQLQAGEEETIEFVADKSGDFEYYCSVGNHRQMGMKGTLTVK